jgi:hypothetical protein
MFVKPAPDRLVRDPKTLDHLPPEGREVPRDTYWIRLLQCGDVVEAAPAAPAPAPEPEPQPE